MDTNNLQEVAKRIEVLNGISEMSDDEIKELENLNRQAAKLMAKKQSEAVLLAAQAESAEENERKIQAAASEAVKRERAKWEAENRRLPFGEAPYQSQFSDEAKYDNLGAVELSLAMETMKAFAAKGVRYVNGGEINIPAAAFKALSRRIAELKNESNTEEGRKAVDYIKNAFKYGTKTNIDPTVEGVDAAIKAATDPMYTGGANIGTDWVGTAYSPELWRQIRAETRVVGKIPAEVIPDGYSNKTWPLESTDMTWYKVAEATSSDSTLKVPAATVTASQIATDKKNITVGKLGARGLYTQELDEDSLVRFSTQLRDQLAVSGAEMLESLVIDGDVETSASKNINAIDTTPSATDYYLTFDGFRKLPLITTTANSLSAGGSLSIDDFLSVLKLMGTAGIAGADPSKVSFIVDGNTYYAMAKLPEVKTRDVNSAATVENGFVQSVWNVGVIPSWQMHKISAKRMANTAGKIDADTDSNNTTGSVVAVRWDQWKLVYKRRMTMEVTRIANADSWEIVALTRLGLGYRDAEASAILYNVGV
jgi:hypothetical protein